MFAGHRKNNHPKRTWRQVRLDVEGLDLLPVRTGAVWDFDLYQEVERRAHRFSRVALKRGHQAVILQTGRACPYLVGSGCPARSGGARGCDGLALSRARMCPRIVAMTSGSSMQAMTRSVPPHFGQVSMSMANTRFSRCIHVMGAGDGPGFACSGSRLGTIRCRCLQFGANTPWKRVRLSLGRGTSAARRAIKSSGSSTTCVVPSRQGCLKRTMTCPRSFIESRSLAMAGNVAAELFEPVALVGFAAGCGVQGKPRLPGEQG